MLLDGRINQNKAEKLCSEMLSALLNNRNSDGSLGDTDTDVLTHHLLLVLIAWNHRTLETITKLAIKWFEDLEDYRENKDTDFNPFKLYAFTYGQWKEQKNYVSDKIQVLRRCHRKAHGYVVLQLGFTAAGDVHEVFPTLMAADLLISEGSEESLSAAHNTIAWAMEEIDRGSVYQNLSSILGFAALVTTKFNLATGNEEFSPTIEHLLLQLEENQSDGLWENSKYQSSYVFFDLAQLSKLKPRNHVSDMLDAFLIKVLEPEFFEDDEITGQNAVLVYATLLRGFAALISSRKKNAIIQRVLNNSLKDSADYNRKRVFIERYGAQIEDIMRNFQERRFIPVNPKIFNERQFTIDRKQVFVLMPYNEKIWFRKDPETGQPRSESYNFDGPYNKLIVPTINLFGLKCIRADSIFAPNPFMEKIWRQINESGLILADVTSGNPNVLYELGIAHTLGKPIIILTQDPVYVPTDLQAIEYVKYDPNLGKEDEFQINLTKAIQDTIM